MIRLTRLNGHPVYLNSELIKFVEASPDTVITLTNGEKVIARESAEEVAQLVLDVRRATAAGLTDEPVSPGIGEHSQHSSAEAARRG